MYTEYDLDSFMAPERPFVTRRSALEILADIEQMDMREQDDFSEEGDSWQLRNEFGEDC
jgi:hypothetical protein